MHLNGIGDRMTAGLEEEKFVARKRTKSQRGLGKDKKLARLQNMRRHDMKCVG
jgi:hypothetical protein